MALRRHLLVYLICALVLGVTGSMLVALGLGPGGLFLALVVCAGAVLAVLHQLTAADQPLPRPLAPSKAGRPDALLPPGERLLEQIPVPLLLLDARGRIVLTNAAALALAPRLLPGQPIATIFRAPAFVESVSEVFVDGEARSVEFHQPGQDRYLQAQVALLPHETGNGVGPLAVLQLADKTADRLAEKMRTDFIANASHELRTPLASILGYIETLQGHAKDDAEAREHFLKIMEREAGRMRRLVDDLMSLSRIELSAHLRPEEICDLGDIASEVVSALQPLAMRREVKLTCSLEGDASYLVRGDRDQLAQIVANLLENGIRHGRAGGRVLATVDTDRGGRRIGIAVEDDGPGIERLHVARLTERFYRAGDKRGKRVEGTGLGLAIVKHILNRHGGELEIRTELGKGSRFTAWLPALPPRLPERDASGAQEKSAVSAA